MSDNTIPQPEHVPAGFLRRHWRTVSALIALAGDAFTVVTGFCVACLLVYPGIPLIDILQSHLHFLLFSILVFLGGLTAFGVYRTISYIPARRHFLIAGRSFLYGAGISICALFIVQNNFYSRQFLGVYFAILPVIYALVWSVLRKANSMLRHHRFGRQNTLVIGFDKTLDRLLERVYSSPELGYDIVRVIRSQNGGDDQFLHVESQEVEMAVEGSGVEQIVLSSSHLNGSFDALENICRKYKLGMSVLSDESDYLFTRTNIYDLAGVPVFAPERHRVEMAKRTVKRAFDVIGSFLLLVALSPLFLLVAIATKLESPGPVFFKQKRGLSDQDEPFEFYKFRSMHHASDEIKESLVGLNESSGALFKIKNDPRLTRVGKFIRRHSIDELPQLFNVLKGDMSLVGPRPLPCGDFKLLQERDHLGGYFRHRGKAKPGMSGLWQVSGRSDLGFREMVLLDLYYVEHQTILFDIEILVQTIPVVLFGKGAY